MKTRMHRFMVTAVLAATIPALAIAQAQQERGARDNERERGRMERLSPEARARLQDGRIAMIKETLKLSDAQLKLWAPVEAQMRAAVKARQQLRAERRQARDEGAELPSLADRLDRASQAMAKRAEQMKAFADAFKPFYAGLSDEQKALAGVVLDEGRGGHRGRG